MNTIVALLIGMYMYVYVNHVVRLTYSRLSLFRLSEVRHLDISAI